MSLLMDALKRAEKARQAEAAKQAEGDDTPAAPQELSLVDPVEERKPPPQPPASAKPPPPRQPPPPPDKSTELQFSLEDTNTSMLPPDSSATDTGKELGPFSLVEDEDLSREDTGEMAPIARDAERAVNEYFDDASSMRISLDDVRSEINEETVSGTQPVSTDEMARQAAHTVFDAKVPSAKRRRARTAVVVVPLFLILFLAVSGFFLWDSIVRTIVGPPPIVSRQPPPPAVPAETQAPPAVSTAQLPLPAEPAAGTSSESTEPAGTASAEAADVDSEAEKLASKLMAATAADSSEPAAAEPSSPASTQAQAVAQPEPGVPPAPSAEEIAALTRQALAVAPTAGRVSQLPSLKISRKSVPDPAHQLLAQAYEAFQQGRNGRARNLYQNVLAQEPSNRNALLGIAAVALRSGDAAGASRTYARLLSLNPRDPVARAALIDLQQNVSPIEGEGHIRQLLNYYPEQPFLYASLGNLLARQSRWPEAQFAYFEAYRLDSDNPDYAFNLAVGLDQIGQRGAALDYYRRALELAEDGQANFDVQSVLKRISILSVPESG